MTASVSLVTDEARERFPARGPLTDHELVLARDEGELYLDPFDPELVRPAAVSLRLGFEAFDLVSTGPVDVADPGSYPELQRKVPDERGRLRLDPGTVLLAPTLERVGVSPRLAGLVDGTSDYARLGVSVVLSGQVSPGFGWGEPGVLTLELVSHLRHPVLLVPGTRICNLMLFPSAGSEQPYDARPHNHSGKQSVTPSRLAEHVGRT